VSQAKPVSAPSAKGKLAVFFIKSFAKLPSSVSFSMAWLIAKLQLFFPNKVKFVIKRNLQLCMPQLSQKEHDELVKKTLRENAKLIADLPFAWCGSKKQISQRIVEVNRQHLITPYVENKKPLIIAFPHLGNWEFVWHWIQINYPAIGLYRDAKIPEVGDLLREARCKFGGKAYPADARGLIALVKALKQGSIMGILPDQAPKGSGIFTPFFGIPAYTMTLVHRLIQKTDADLLMASCRRIESGKNFCISFYEPTFNIKQENVELFNLGMNQQLESIILECPEQYQWAYKRFKRQQDGSNYYR
jgi:KDO2-lipid IV(A) lauroyltransferase